MAGGTFTSMNKIIPGVYINTKSSGGAPVSIGDKGIVAIAKALSWGPTGVISEYIPGEDPTPLIGYDITSDDALFLREMLKGSDTTSGPKKILLYRLTGTAGVKATATVGALTATAKYTGKRGNDITIIIAQDVDDTDLYHITTVLSGDIVDKQSVKNLSNLTANAWVDFTGTGTTITTTAGTALTTGADPTISTSDYSAFLTALEPFQFDIVAYDGSDSTVVTALTSFVQRMANTLGKKCQGVVGDAAGVNTEWMINVANGVKLSDGTALTAQQAVWWVAGSEAGAQYNQSLTYAQYPGAAEANAKLTNAQIEAAILAGKLVFIDEFDTVKVCTDIDSLTTYTPEKGQEFSKNRVMRTLNQICNDVYKQGTTYFIGKVNNDATGRNLLKGWIVGYLNEIQANSGIQNFTAEDVEVLPGNTIDSVIVNIWIQPVDSIEKIYVTVTVSVNAE